MRFHTALSLALQLGYAVVYMEQGSIGSHPGKQLVIAIGGVPYARYPVRTHLVLSGEDLVTTLPPYLTPYLASGDTVFVSEKIVAIAEGRAYPIREIRPSSLARLLVRFVDKSPETEIVYLHRLVGTFKRDPDIGLRREVVYLVWLAFFEREAQCPTIA